MANDTTVHASRAKAFSSAIRLSNTAVLFAELREKSHTQQVSVCNRVASTEKTRAGFGKLSRRVPVGELSQGWIGFPGPSVFSPPMSNTGPFWVYVLQNPAGKFSIGYIDDLDRRVGEYDGLRKLDQGVK